MKTILLRGLQLITFGGALFAAYPSNAAIMSISGNIQMLPGGAQNFWQLDNFFKIPQGYGFFAFDEYQNVVIPSGSEVKIHRENVNYNPNDPLSLFIDWDDLANLPSLGEGVSLNSHLVYFWKPTGITERINAEASITFGKNEIVVGFMGDKDLILNSNYLFAPEINFSWNFSRNPDWEPKIRTLEGLKWRNAQQRDQVRFGLDENGNQILNTLQLKWSTHSGLEALRVITMNYTPPANSLSTENVPEPFTIFGVATAVGFGSLFKRKISRKSK